MKQNGSPRVSLPAEGRRQTLFLMGANRCKANRRGAIFDLKTGAAAGCAARPPREPLLLRGLRSCRIGFGCAPDTAPGRQSCSVTAPKKSREIEPA